MRHGRYTIIRKLAEGGMAEIFLAKQHGSVGFERPVVLKRIHTAFYADEQFRNMLVDEAHISMGLHHNNIVQTLDVGEAGGRYFLVLELVDGWDLGRLLNRATNAKLALPPALGIYVVAEVCRALAYAHGRLSPSGAAMAIVHRDVSPQNVLVSDQGEVKLADFGIAKAMTKRDKTASGVVKGKIAFMSPEQAQGLAIDARSDLYSLGSVLYLVTTGRRPFEAPTDLEVLLRVQKGELVPPELMRPDLPPGLVAVLHRVLQVDPEQRYQTAEELLVDLEGVLRAEYDSAGQTELKLFLAELSRRDGVPPISRAAPDFGDRITDSGELIAGNAVELGDEAGSMDGVDGLDAVEAPRARRPSRLTSPTMAATPGRKRTGSNPRLTNDVQLPGDVRMTGNEATAMTDLALSVAETDDAPPMPSRRRGGGRGVGVVIVTALVVAAAGIIWKRMHPADASVPAAAEAAAVPAPAPVAPPVATKPVPPPAPKPAVEPPKPAVEPPPQPAAAVAPAHAAHPAAPEPAPAPAATTPTTWRRIQAPVAVDPAPAPAAPPSTSPPPAPAPTEPPAAAAPPPEAAKPTEPPPAQAEPKPEPTPAPAPPPPAAEEKPATEPKAAAPTEPPAATP